MKADLTRNSFHPFKHYIRVLMQQGRVQLDADWNEQAAILLHYLEALAADLIGPHGGPSMQPGFTNPGFTISPYPTAKSPLTSDFKIELGRYYVDGKLCEADSTPIHVFFPKPKDSPNLLQVDTWSLDGAEFQDNQYVEVFDDAENPKFSPPTVVQITNPDKANRQLTIQGLPTNAKFINATNPKLRRAITYLTQPDYPVPSSDHLSADSRYQVYLDVWERHITYVEDDGIRECFSFRASSFE